MTVTAPVPTGQRVRPGARRAGTSAAGEEVEIPPQYAQRTHALVSIISRDSSALPYQDWDLKSVQPIVLRQNRPPGSSPPGCIVP